MQDVRKVGKKWEVREVSDGYAKNLLIPKELAKLATPAEIVEIEKRKKREEVAAGEKRQKILEMADKIKSQNFEFKVKTDENGHIFGSIGEREILKKLKEEKIGVEKVLVEHPFKKTGIYEVEADFGLGVVVDIKINIVSE